MTANEIVVPTLEQIEEFWRAHPDMEATTCDTCACIVAIPMNHLNPGKEFSVYPNGIFAPMNKGATFHPGEPCIFLRTEIGQIPLPAELTTLARKFDAIGFDRSMESRDDYDSFSEEDKYPLSAAICVELVRAVRSETREGEGE